MKKFRWDKKYLYWGVTAFCVIVASVAFYLLLSNFNVFGSAVGRLTTILSPFIWGLVISYLLCPVTNILQRHVFTPLITSMASKTKSGGHKRKNLSNGLAVFFAMMFLLAILAAFVWLVAPQLYTSIESIIANSSVYISNVLTWLDTVLEDFPVVQQALGTSFGSASEAVFSWAESFMLPKIQELVTSVTSGVFSVVKGVYNVIIGMVAAVYVLYNRVTFAAHMKKIVYCIFSVEAAEKIISAVKFSDRVFNGFLSGKILDSAIIGIICYVCCSLLRMPYALLVSVIVGITNIIPFFGPFIGAIPSSIIILMVDPVKCIIFIVFVFLLQQFDGNFLGPKILGNSVGVNGFWIMFSIIVGSGLFGFMGMLLGVPVFVLLYTFFTAIINRKLHRSGLPTETDEYRVMSHIDPETGTAVERDEELIRKERKEFRKGKKFEFKHHKRTEDTKAEADKKEEK